LLDATYYSRDGTKRFQKFLRGAARADPELEDPLLMKTGGDFSRPVEPVAMFRWNLPLLAQGLNSELEVWGSYGAVAFALRQDFHKPIATNSGNAKVSQMAL